MNKPFMRVSAVGAKLIGETEALRLSAYQDPGSKNGLPITIGRGSTKKMDGGLWSLGDTITEEEAEELFRRDLRDSEVAVNSLVQVPLTQSQFDALVSLVYNIGKGAFAKSTLLRLLNSGDYENAAKQFDRWVYNDGKVLKGLVTRRAKERAMFEMPGALVTTVPTVQAPVDDVRDDGTLPAPITQSLPTSVNPEPGPIPDRPKVSTIELVSSLWKAVLEGKKLANSATWKKRQNAVNALTAVLVGGVALAGAFGYDFQIEEEILASIGGGIWAVVSLFNNWATTATTADVGLHPRNQDNRDWLA